MAKHFLIALSLILSSFAFRPYRRALDYDDYDYSGRYAVPRRGRGSVSSSSSSEEDFANAIGDCCDLNIGCSKPCKKRIKQGLLFTSLAWMAYNAFLISRLPEFNGEPLNHTITARQQRAYQREEDYRTPEAASILRERLEKPRVRTRQEVVLEANSFCRGKSEAASLPLLQALRKEADEHVFDSLKIEQVERHELSTETTPNSTAEDSPHDAALKEIICTDWLKPLNIIPIGINNQNPCGSCWAMATGQQLEAQINLKFRDGVPRRVDLGEIISCSHRMGVIDSSKGDIPQSVLDKNNKAPGTRAWAYVPGRALSTDGLCEYGNWQHWVWAAVAANGVKILNNHDMVGDGVARETELLERVGTVRKQLWGGERENVEGAMEKLGLGGEGMSEGSGETMEKQEGEDDPLASQFAYLDMLKNNEGRKTLFGDAKKYGGMLIFGAPGNVFVPGIKKVGDSVILPLWNKGMKAAIDNGVPIPEFIWRDPNPSDSTEQGPIPLPSEITSTKIANPPPSTVAPTTQAPTPVPTPQIPTPAPVPTPAPITETKTSSTHTATSTKTLTATKTSTTYSTTTKRPQYVDNVNDDEIPAGFEGASTWGGGSAVFQSSFGDFPQDIPLRKKSGTGVHGDNDNENVNADRRSCARRNFVEWGATRGFQGRRLKEGKMVSNFLSPQRTAFEGDDQVRAAEASFRTVEAESSQQPSMNFVPLPNQENKSLPHHHFTQEDLAEAILDHRRHPLTTEQAQQASEMHLTLDNLFDFQDPTTASQEQAVAALNNVLDAPNTQNFYDKMEREEIEAHEPKDMTINSMIKIKSLPGLVRNEVGPASKNGMFEVNTPEEPRPDIEEVVVKLKVPVWKQEKYDNNFGEYVLSWWLEPAEEEHPVKMIVEKPYDGTGYINYDRIRKYDVAQDLMTYVTDESIMRQLIRRTPFIVCVDANALSILDTKGDKHIISKEDYEKTIVGNHYMQAVGFDYEEETENYKQWRLAGGVPGSSNEPLGRGGFYWMLKNSWGGWAHDQGYAKFRYKDQIMLSAAALKEDVIEICERFKGSDKFECRDNELDYAGQI